MPLLLEILRLLPSAAWGPTVGDQKAAGLKAEWVRVMLICEAGCSQEPKGQFLSFRVLGCWSLYEASFQRCRYLVLRWTSWSMEQNAERAKLFWLVLMITMSPEKLLGVCAILMPLRNFHALRPDYRPRRYHWPGSEKTRTLLCQYHGGVFPGVKCCCIPLYLISEHQLGIWERHYAYFKFWERC